MVGEKGAPIYTLERLSELADGQWVVLSGGTDGATAISLESDGPTAAGRQLDLLVEAFGQEHVVVEIWDHATPLCSTRNDALVRLAAERDLRVVATNDVRYAGQDHRHLATALSLIHI